MKIIALASIVFAALIFPVTASASETELKTIDQAAVFKQLNTALGYFDETSELPDDKWFSRDKSSANKDLDETINEVIQLLDAPEIGRSRNNYRILEQKTIQEYNEIARLQEQRLFAPIGEATFIADKVPFAKVKEWTAKTRDDFDALIALRKDNIAAHKESMNAILLDMQKLFYSMGIEFDAEQIEVWLSSVVGDSVLSMSVVFNSIKQITQQLEVATADSGENLSFAKRYYGMVVILHKLMLKMQTDFLTTIDNAYLPKLVNFKNEANAVIKESEKLLRSGGNRETLKLNIQSNKMTIKVIDLYASLLKEQRSKIFEAMQMTQREYEVSNNTYKTVNLSSQVSQLIKQGRNTFQTLINLQIPSAQPFQNEEMKEQFRLLSQRLNN
ncbi:hypothetical protein [Alishewanella sp. HL-SH05]|uniref:hypothetical protein n=1 Tax=Alishewanella sp. HL-SH05 TaxID=3461145 RepID=UPI004043610E